jgi:hypothetical protein
LQPTSQEEEQTMRRNSAIEDQGSGKGPGHETISTPFDDPERHHLAQQKTRSSAQASSARDTAAGVWAHAVFLVLLAGALALHLYNLGHRYLAPWDEVTHAVVAEHVGKDLLHPILYQIAALSPAHSTNWTIVHTWLHIPPLGLWASGLSMDLLGDTPFALRLPGVFFVAIGMIATYLLGRRLYGAVAGLMGAAFVGYAPYALLLNQGYVFGDITDTPLLALTPLAGLALVYGCQAARRRWLWLVVAGIFQGLCYLTKGPIGLAPTGVALALCASDYLLAYLPGAGAHSPKTLGPEGPEYPVRNLKAPQRRPARTSMIGEESIRTSGRGAFRPRAVLRPFRAESRTYPDGTFNLHPGADRAGWRRLGITGLLLFLGATALVAAPYNIYIAHAFPATYRIESNNWRLGLFSNYENWGRPVDYHLTVYLFALYGAALALLLVSAVVTLAIVGLARWSRADLVVAAWIVALYLPLTLAVTKAVPMTIAAVPAFGLALGRFLTLGLSARSRSAWAATLGLLLGAVAMAVLILRGVAQPSMTYGNTGPSLFLPHGIGDRIAPYLQEAGLSLAFGLLCAAILWLWEWAAGLWERAMPAISGAHLALAGKRFVIGSALAAALVVLPAYWMYGDLQVVVRPTNVAGPIPALGTYLHEHVPAHDTVLMNAYSPFHSSVAPLMIMFWAHRDVYELTHVNAATICPAVARAARVGSPVVIMTNQPYNGRVIGSIDGWQVYEPVCP